MGTNTSTRLSGDGLMVELLSQAEAEFKEDRRSEKRFPFFRPASVRVDNHSFSAFTREIGASGIGLLHSMELPLKEVLITISGQPQEFCLRIERCDSIGEGWYISGGNLVETNT